MSVQTFHDDLAARYHLVYEGWNASIARQGAAPDELLQKFFPAQRSVDDVAAGIGTQSLGLTDRTYAVIGSDLSTASAQLLETRWCLRPVPQVRGPSPSPCSARSHCWLAVWGS